MTARTERLKELATVFLRLGTLGFGGPAAHIALMEQEVVRKRGWLTHEAFLDLVGATNLIPGPNSTEMAMHCGQVRAGWQGLIVAGMCFIAPAVLITGAIAWGYACFGALPAVQPFLYGIAPAVIGVVLGAVVTLGRKAVQRIDLALLGALTVAACLLGMSEVLALFLCGFAGIALHLGRAARGPLGLVPLGASGATALGALPLSGLFWTFLKIGAVLYGGGYVLFAFLDAELVRKGLLTHQQLMDAIAVGQFTPGPVLSTATFVGWQLHGPAGALLATVGIFLPSFLFVALLGPLVPRLRRSRVMSAFLDAVNVGAVAVILVVAIGMCRTALTDRRAVTIAVIAVALAIGRPKLNSAWLVVGGALAGYVLCRIPG